MLTPFQCRAARALADTEVFGTLGEERFGLVHRTAVRKGELLFAKGELGDRLFGLLSGQLKVFSTPAPGRELALDFVAPGELLGELGVLDSAPRHASVKALAHSELATIKRSALDPLLEADPKLRASLSGAAARTATRLAERAEDLAFLSIERQLEKVLVDLAARFGELVEHGTRIRLRQQELADMLGVSRESVSRALATPALRSRCRVRRGSIVLLGA